MGDVSDALSTAIQHRKALPTVFEVFAQENLHESIKPACKHIVKVLAQRRPEYFSFLYQSFDELYAVVSVGLQSHFLCNHSASVSEYYYDLIRQKEFSQLDVKRQLASLFTLTMLPYVQSKAEDAFNEQLQTSNQSKSILTKILHYIYPILHTLWNAANLYFYFAFAIGKSDFHSPIYKLLNIKLTRVNPFDDKNLGTFSKLISHLLTGGVHAGVFILRFIQWWYAEDHQNPLRQSSVLSPPPNNKSKHEDGLIAVPTTKGVCPLCQRTRRNQTALLTSGYVFCYICIYKYVKKYKRCPVTGYHTDVDHLTKIYLNTD